MWSYFVWPTADTQKKTSRPAFSWKHTGSSAPGTFSHIQHLEQEPCSTAWESRYTQLCWILFSHTSISFTCIYGTLGFVLKRGKTSSKKKKNMSVYIFMFITCLTSNLINSLRKLQLKTILLILDKDHSHFYMWIMRTFIFWSLVNCCNKITPPTSLQELFKNILQISCLSTSFRSERAERCSKDTEGRGVSINTVIQSAEEEHDPRIEQVKMHLFIIT